MPQAHLRSRVASSVQVAPAPQRQALFFNASCADV